MTAQADPLRNTLDHLALDPRAKEDRKYLVSMLRRLGYSEAEIQEALGPIESERVIEVEYKPPRETSTDFEVVRDETWGEEGVGFQATPGYVGGAYDPALEHGWIPVDDGEEEPPVAFEERDPTAWPEEPAEAASADAQETAWPEEPTEETWSEEPVEEAWPEEATEAAPWEETDELVDAATPVEDVEPQETSVDRLHEAEATVDTWDPEPHPEDDGGWELAEETWQEVPEETEADEWTAPAEPWTEETSDVAGDETWEPADEQAPEADTQAADEPAALSEWEDSGEYAVTEPPANAWEPAETTEAFTYEDYMLYTRTVELSTGREQRIFFFAKNEPKSGRPCPLPAGYKVEQNDRTGLPFLRRDPDAEVVEDFSDPAWDDTTAVTLPERVEAVQCNALTKTGEQCKKSPREGSKYCTVHKGHRGPTAE